MAFGLALPNLTDIGVIPEMDPIYSLERIHMLAVILFLGTIAVMTVVAAADFVSKT